MSTKLPEAVSCEQLMRMLNSVVGLGSFCEGLIRHACSKPVVAKAQRKLELAGYYLVERQMIEGSYYELTYAPRVSVYEALEHYPHRVDIRFNTNQFEAPPLTLAFHKNGELHFCMGSQLLPSGTSGPKAQEVLEVFAHYHPDTLPMWLPIFDNHWPVVSR